MKNFQFRIIFRVGVKFNPLSPRVTYWASETAYPRHQVDQGVLSRLRKSLECALLNELRSLQAIKLIDRAHQYKKMSVRTSRITYPIGRYNRVARQLQQIIYTYNIRTFMPESTSQTKHYNGTVK